MDFSGRTVAVPFTIVVEVVGEEVGLRRQERWCWWWQTRRSSNRSSMSNTAIST